MTIDPSDRTLKGEVTLHITNASAGDLANVHLWLFPERLSHQPTGMSEIEEEWMFPSGFSRGGMKLGVVTDNSGKELQVSYPQRTLAKVELARAHRKGEVVTIHVPFETTIPERYGPFGAVGGQITMDGGFFPRPPPLGSEGYQDDAPPGPIDYTLRLEALGLELYAVVNGEPKQLKQAATWVRGGRHAVTRISVVLLPDLYMTRLEESGVRVTLVHSSRRHMMPTDGGLPDLTTIDTQGEIVATVGLALRYLKRLNTVSLPHEVTLIVAPLRRDLSIESQGMVLVSDRAFDLPGLERFRRLHRTALLRSVMGSIIRDTVAGKQTSHWRDRAVDLVALELVARWESKRYGSRYDLSRALSAGAFVAQVDEVLYAPQIPLQQVFFRPVDDTDRFRDRFELFSHKQPNGQRLHVKLQDRSNEGSVGALVDDLLDGLPFERAYQKHFKDPGSLLLRQWDGGYPALNYRLVSSTVGRDVDGNYVDVVIQQQGDKRIVEPVKVAVWETTGRVVYETWNGEGSRVRLRIRTKAPAERVQLDPKHRLLEVVQDGDKRPREDNQDYETWKFLIQGIALGFASSGQNLNVRLLSSLKPSFSVDHTVLLEPYDSGFGTGLMTSYYYHFGKLIRPNLRQFYLGLYGGGEWRRESDLWASGLRASLALGVGGSTYVSRVTPTSGSRWTVNAAVKLGNEDESRLALRLLADYAHLVPLSDGHVMAFRLSAATAFGDLDDSNRWRLGGAGRVRSFGLLSQTGNHRILGALEWRHRWVRGLNISLAQLSWIRSIHGVLFLDAALLANELDALVKPSSLFMGIGYGLRFVYHVFGLYPSVLALDVSVPIITGRELQVKSDLPFSILATAGQSF